MIKRTTLALFLLFTGVSLGPAAFAAEPLGDHVWIDLRSVREYRQGHLEGAINIPHGDIGHRMLDVVDDRFTIVHLYDGNRGTFAGLALELLMEMGFQDVINEGDYAAILARQSATDQ